MSRLSRVERGLLAAALLAFVATAGDSLRRKSATYDETAHLAAGYTYLRFGDYRLNPEHPPLLKELAALPLLALDVRFEPDDEAWRLARQWEIGRRLLYRWNDADLLLAGRLPMLSLGALLGLAVFLWARRLWGSLAGWLALLACLSSPDVLAHTRLVTTDLGLTLFVFLAVVAFERLTDAVTWPRILSLGFSVGAAFASKYSAPFLVPTLALLVLVAVFSQERWDVRLPPFSTRTPTDRRQRLLAWSRVLGLAAGVAVMTVWAAYGFRSEPSPDPEVVAELGWSRLAPEPGLLGTLESGLRTTGLLPQAWHDGFRRVLRHSEARQGFLHGEISEEGFPHFLVVSFFLKTPLAFLALLTLGVTVRTAPRLSWLAVACLALPTAVYAVLTLTRGLSIGHRHLLPLYPFLFVAAGRAAAWAWPPDGAAPRWRRVLVSVLVAGCLAVPVRIHPNYLAFFNALAGGPAGGHRWLVDSSLDWGQDLPALAEWQREHAAHPLRLAYFGTADPAAYGLEVTWLPSYLSPPAHHVERRIERGDIVAVSVTLLQGLYLEPEDAALLARFRDVQPIGHAGHSILIYRADFDWP